MRQSAWRMIWLTGFACMALAGCGGEEQAAEVPAPQAPATPPPTAPAAGNIAPVISGTPSLIALAGTPWQLQVSATDSDSTTLTFSAEGLPEWILLDPQTGLLSGTPTNDDAGETADITVSVSDGQNTASLPIFRIAVAAVQTGPTPPPAANNQAPAISGTPVTTIAATRVYTFTPTATDVDSTGLTFSITNRPTWASFSTSTGRLSGTPSRTQVRAYSNIVIRVSDGSLTTALPAFAINVTAAPNSTPTIGGSPTTTVTAGSIYSFTPTSADVDGQTLGFSISGRPAWATFSTVNGQLSGTPTSSNVGTYSGITISVSDGTATTAMPAFSITVNATANAAPTISGTPSTGVVAGSAYSFTPSASDPNGDTLTFSVSGRPTWASLNTATGALTGSPTSAQVGSYSNIVISVSDGTTTRSLAAFSITVTSPNTGTGTATLNWTAPTQNTDGSPLTNLTGYRVYHGTSASALTDVRTISSPGISTYVFDTLASGTHYFAIAAVANGVESALSGTGSKTIP